MLHWLGILTDYLIACSPCSMAVARPIIGLCRLTHITDTLVSFHWLRAPERTKFKLASLSTELFTALCFATYLISWAALLTCRLGVDFGRQLPTNLLSVCHILLQFGNDHLLLPCNSLPYHCVLLCFIVHHVLHFFLLLLLCLSVCVYIFCLCLWAMLPDLNKMMMMMIICFINDSLFSRKLKTHSFRQSHQDIIM